MASGSEEVAQQRDGELVHLRSLVGIEAYGTPDAVEAYERLFPMVPARGSITCQAIRDREIVHVRDMASEPGVSAAVHNLGHESQIAPLSCGAATGADHGYCGNKRSRARSRR
jgi:hypothetical protein